VRAILRRPSAITTIASSRSIQPYLHLLSYFIVPDNTLPNGYDEALAGADYVIHIAGAWPMPHLHPDNDIYYPFMRSMQSLISAATKSGTVRRCVFTQAGASLVDAQEGDGLGRRMERVLNGMCSLPAFSFIYVYQ
jgi:hypothetical protein